jgi:hypothetical protein
MAAARSTAVPCSTAQLRQHSRRRARRAAARSARALAAKCALEALAPPAAQQAPGARVAMLNEGPPGVRPRVNVGTTRCAARAGRHTQHTPASPAPAAVGAAMASGRLWQQLSKARDGVLSIAADVLDAAGDAGSESDSGGSDDSTGSRFLADFEEGDGGASGGEQEEDENPLSPATVLLASAAAAAAPRREEQSSAERDGCGSCVAWLRCAQLRVALRALTRARAGCRPVKPQWRHPRPGRTPHHRRRRRAPAAERQAAATSSLAYSHTTRCLALRPTRRSAAARTALPPWAASWTCR